MPDDELSKYLPTQAIADYLATEREPSLDGMIFPSVQVSGKGRNVVLFRKASCVEPLNIPPGAEFYVSSGHMDEYGWQYDYSVSVTVPDTKPPTPAPPPEGPFDFRTFLSADAADAEEGEEDEQGLFYYAPPTLRIDLEEIHVHIVQAVEFTAETHRVYRWQRTKSERDNPDF
jgi:hypothetical protein